MQDFALTRRRATYADLEAMPTHMVAEIIDGELVTMPRPGPRHTFSYSGLGVFVGGPFQYGRGGPGGWWILDEPELHLDQDVLVPDLAGWRKERMPRLPDTAYFALSPDWVCELISPSTEQYDRGPKRDIYARSGVGHLWLVDPDARLLEAFALDAGSWRLVRTYRDNELVDAPPFGEVPFDLGHLWAD